MTRRVTVTFTQSQQINTDLTSSGWVILANLPQHQPEAVYFQQGTEPTMAHEDLPQLSRADMPYLPDGAGLTAVINTSHASLQGLSIPAMTGMKGPFYNGMTGSIIAGATGGHATFEITPQAITFSCLTVPYKW
jgi:hypothetical protein